MARISCKHVSGIRCVRSCVLHNRSPKTSRSLRPKPFGKRFNRFQSRPPTPRRQALSPFKHRNAIVCSGRISRTYRLLQHVDLRIAVEARGRLQPTQRDDFDQRYGKRLSESVFHEAAEVLQMIAKNPEERLLYELSLKRERDIESMVAQGREEELATTFGGASNRVRSKNPSNSPEGFSASAIPARCASEWTLKWTPIFGPRACFA